MIVRFGFVAMSVLLENASPSRTMTYANFTKLADREAALRKLERITEENLKNALRMLKHAAAHDIRMYRFSSKIIPLTTHEGLSDWDPYRNADVREAFAKVGAFARDKHMRVSFHPDHFCVLNTPKPDVLQSSIRDMNYHIRMLEAMGLDERAKCNIHVGGSYGDKCVSGDRFVSQFGELDAKLQSRVTLENDDKTFNTQETLEIAERAGVPMVLDIHHHAVNDGGITGEQLLGDLWPRIVQTWERENDRLAASGQGNGEQAALAGQREEGTAGRELILPPKIHASSPKSSKDPRGHADHVDYEPLLRFLQGAAASCKRLDVMLEAKRKDEALMRLMDDFRAAEQRGESVQVVDGATIMIPT
ncbi:UV DNA damage repair endonuclease UvsE [Paenibacillus sambharensis]|uniref:UV DNA damage repair endonuclease UvsE n=1 Tax=Paenibacillus sambharensis TaxID=1803190 RepID=A0A2W1LMG6_9BACL|nr:UV DNA damage repair endonuclease UvsE [Paenibacillus sambharensis]PZD95624.1 UV DNA damage repair endonuclease UvsE [Paenibacillus sambharensis]